MKYLGTISIATTATKSNLDTASPFAIPAGLDSLLVVPSATGLLAQLSQGAATLATDATSGYPLGAAAFQIPAMTSTTSNVLSVYNPTGGTLTVKVWGLVSYA